MKNSKNDHLLIASQKLNRSIDEHQIAKTPGYAKSLVSRSQKALKEKSKQSLRGVLKRDGIIAPEGDCSASKHMI